MLGIFMTAGSIGVVLGSGLLVSSAFNWFHNYDLEFGKKKKKEEPISSGPTRTPHERLSGAARNIRKQGGV